MQRFNPVRWGCMLALLLALGAQTAQAQLLSVTVAGVDKLIDTAKYGLTMAGKKDLADQITGVVDAFGLKGLDTKKPIGAYLNKFPSNPTSPGVVVYVPITSEEDFVDLIGKTGLAPSKEEKGTRSIGLPNGQQLYMKVKGNYAFFCLDEDELKNPTDPAKLTANAPASALFHLHAGFNEVPQELKDRFLSEIDKLIQKEQGRRDGENDVQYQARLMSIKMPRQAIEQLVRGAQSLSVTVGLDQSKHRFHFDMTLTPKPDSVLHHEMKAMTQSKSGFTSLLESAPASLVAHGIMTDEVRKDFDNLLDTIVKKAIASEKSMLKKALAEKIYQVLEPTLKDKNYELALSIRSQGEQKPMTALGALHVKNGKQIEELLRGLMEEMKENEKQFIKLDVEKVGDVNVHVIDLPANDQGAKEAVEFFGATRFALAFHNDAIVGAFGKDCQDEVKRILQSLGKSGSSNPSSMQLSVHVKPFARFVKETPVRKAFDTTFTTPDSDEVKISVTGGDQLRWRFEASTQFLKLIEAAEKARE